jgi:hypothetical protein
MPSRSAVLVVAAFAACDAPLPVEHDATLVFRARGPDGTSVEGVAVTAGGRPLGTTGPDGTLRATVRGRRGARFALSATCVVPLVAVGTLPPFILQDAIGLGGTREPFAVDISCQRRDREVAMLIRAVADVRGRDRSRPLGGVPILLRDQVVGHTDADGLAHVTVVAALGSRVDLTLATSRAALGEVEPVDPTIALVVEPESSLAVVDQRFVIEPARARRARRARRASPPPSPAPQPHRIRVLTGTEADLVELSTTQESP